MKRYFLLLAAAATMLLPACSKQNETPQPEPTPDPEIPEIKVEVYEEDDYSLDEFCEFYGHSFDDYCEYLGEYVPASEIMQFNLSAFVLSHRHIIDSLIVKETGLDLCYIKDKWNITKYSFTYESTSYSGESITLSAALIVPSVGIANVNHRLNAMSLCPPHMFIEDERCPTENGTVLMGRVMYNHAVVVPDYQGRGVTSQMCYSCLHTHDHATQAIDAAVAAQTLLAQLGYVFEDGYCLYNVGVSEGGENSYEIQKQIENDKPEYVRTMLNLKHNFAANGSYDHVQYVKDKIARVEYSDQETFESDMQILHDAFECLTAEEKQGYDASILYSTEILAEDGVTLNQDHPVFAVLEKAMERNNIDYNWNPQTPLRLAGSYDDTTIKLESHAIPAFEMIKYRPDFSENPNVSLNAFYTPVAAKINELVGERYMIAHIIADMICFVHAIEYEDPGSVEITKVQF